MKISVAKAANSRMTIGKVINTNVADGKTKGE